MSTISSTTDSYKLQITGLHKRYKNGDGIHNIDLNVSTGEFVTLLGPSGCGKTTILRSIGGFVDVDEGDIRIDGQSVAALPPEKRPTAMVFQSYNLWSHMTIYDNLAFGMKLRKVAKSEIRKQIIEMLELIRMPGSEKKYPAQLSGGQQQRIAIARALLLKPSVLLLDEPFSALDAKIRAEMRMELKRIQQELNITVVFVTHDQEEAMAISDRIVVMNKGHVEQIGTPMEVYDHPASRYVASFIGDMNFIERGDGTSIAVRPEQVELIKGGGGEMQGEIAAIMLLGHYAEINVQAGEQMIKTFQPRHVVDEYRLKEEVGIRFMTEQKLHMI
ncbi:ABC transporter ATP-binding protein [Paenibacillus sanguinis]|uniref:ABC transporter ATP-binding protein n=1 Tax=Paenibacillus sanguinis TaxID=225906 RepID=UPI00037C9301|nr:ABC transporter ATP-binding protein [Paenibacillus sanguinis]